MFSSVTVSSISTGLNTSLGLNEYNSSPSVVAHANDVPSGANLTLFTLIANLVFLLIVLASFLAPGKEVSYLTSHASSSRSEAISKSSPVSLLIFFELSLYKTPSRDLFYVTANLLNSSLCLISYKQIFL